MLHVHIHRSFLSFLSKLSGKSSTYILTMEQWVVKGATNKHWTLTDGQINIRIEVWWYTPKTSLPTWATLQRRFWEILSYLKKIHSEVGFTVQFDRCFILFPKIPLIYWCQQRLQMPHLCTHAKHLKKKIKYHTVQLHTWSTTLWIGIGVLYFCDFSQKSVLKGAAHS